MALRLKVREKNYSPAVISHLTEAQPFSQDLTECELSFNSLPNTAHGQDCIEAVQSLSWLKIHTCSSSYRLFGATTVDSEKNNQKTMHLSI